MRILDFSKWLIVLPLIPRKYQTVAFIAMCFAYSLLILLILILGIELLQLKHMVILLEKYT